MFDLNNDSNAALFLENTKRTIFTALSYNFSFNLPVIGIMMTFLGHDKAVAATTTMLDALACLQLAAVLPTSFEMSRLFGELKELEKSTEQKLLVFRDTSITTVAKKEQSPPIPQITIMSIQLPAEEKISDPTNMASNQNVVTQTPNLKTKIERTSKNGAVVGIMSSIPIFFTMIFSGSVLSLFGQDEKVASPAQTFFTYYAGFFLIFPLRYATEFVLLASKNQKAAMLIAMFAFIATVGLQYALTFKTSLGLEGLSIAAGTGDILTAILYSIYVAHQFKQFNFFRNSLSYTSMDWQQIRRFIKEAIPITLTMASDILIPFVASILAGLLSGTAIAAWNVAAQYLNINIWLIAASSQTTAMLVGEQRGKAKINASTYVFVKRAVWAGLLATLVLQIPLAVFVSSAPTLFSNLTGSNEQSDKHYLMLATAGYALVDGLRNTLLQTTRSLGDNVRSAAISTSMLWLGLGVSYVLSNYTNIAVLGIPIGLSIGALLGTVVLLNRLPKSLYIASLQDNVPYIQQGIVEPTRNGSIQNYQRKGISSWCCSFSRHSDYQRLPDAKLIEAPTPNVQSWTCPSLC